MRLALVLAAALALAGCGGGDAGGGSGGTASLPKHPEAQVPHKDETVEKVQRPESEPKGVMLIFPGGAWLASPPEEVKATRHYEQRYADMGWLAVNVGYRPGGEQSFEDVTRAYDTARADHPGLPICAVGESSGGHLALMLAIERPLDCVEPVDAPTDLTAGLPKVLQRTAASVFGPDELERWSPALRAGEIHGRVLIVQAATDRAVPASQARKLKRALPDAELVLLPEGELGFVHGTKIDKRAYADYLRRERALIQSLRSR